MPLYSVTTKFPKSAPDEPTVQCIQLVEAKSKAAALSHVVASDITVAAVDPKESWRLASLGVKIEQANGAA